MADNDDQTLAGGSGEDGDNALFDQWADHFEGGDAPEDTAEKTAAEDLPPRAAGEAGEDNADAPPPAEVRDTSADEQAGQSEGDPWADAPEKLRTEFEAIRQKAEKLEHQSRSDAGRQAALMRELQQLREKVAAQEAPKDAGEQADPYARLQSAKEDYPDLVEPFEEALTHQKAQIDALTQQLQQQEVAALQANEERVKQEHPDFNAVLAGNDQGQSFVSWLYGTQPLPLVQAFEANRDRIVDPAAAIEVVNRYKQHLQGQQARSASAAGAQPDPLTQRRSAQRTAAAGPTRRTTPRATGMPPADDPKAMFDYFADRV